MLSSQINQQMAEYSAYNFKMSFSKSNSLSNKNTLLTAVAAICLVLFFVAGPDYHSPRSYIHFWNIGHILFFSILSHLIISNWPTKLRTSFLRQSIFVIFFTICLGSLIELVQIASFRTFDLMDVARDISGCLIALAFYAPKRKTLPKTGLITFQAICAILVFMAFLPLIAAIMDETAAREQFPVLSDFETRFETGRWIGDADFSIDRKIHSHGKASLKVVLNTSLYSGVELKYFPENWINYKELRLSIYNPSTKPIQVTCRIHDRQHRRGIQLYEDRFNKTFSIANGWNPINIPFNQIANAPLKRKMELNQIQGLGIFAVSLPKPRTVYIDYVRLANY